MHKQWFVHMCYVSVLMLALGARTAHAETCVTNTANVAMAQKLFDQAMTEMKAEKFVDAIHSLEQVTELMPSGIGGHGKLGECYEKVARLGSAWEQYTIAQNLAFGAGDQERAFAMGAKAKQLEPRVARLTIVVPQELRSVNGLSVMHDGHAEEKALWDTPLPVDKGKHVIEVKADGFQTWTQEVDISVDGHPETILLPTQLVRIPPPMLPIVRPVQTWHRPMGWTMTSMGLVSGAASGVLLGFAFRQQLASTTSGHCDANNQCDQEGIAMRDRAQGLLQGATATAIVGGVLAAGGITMLIVAPKKKDDTPGKTTGLLWNLDVAPQGVRLHGTW